MGVYLLSFLAISGISIATMVLGENISEMISTLLWGFNFIVGSAIALLLRAVLKKLHEKKIMTRQYQNNYLLSRVSGFAFDLMIIAGIGSIEISHLQGLWIPFILMCVVGTIFAFTYQRWICKKLYPDYYFEAFVSMYGMNIGTISSGVLLLREIDPMFKTPAANNLITGSSMAIVFGAPMLALIAIAPQSTQMALLTLGLLVVYTAFLLLFMLKVGKKRKKEES
jgi:ESS family glutamate:Na+ symporter